MNAKKMKQLQSKAKIEKVGRRTTTMTNGSHLYIDLKNNN
jgi:hypothetical protein